MRGCFFCPDNYALQFEPLTTREDQPLTEGYVIPGSMPVTITEPDGGRPLTILVPMPFSALIVPDHHGTDNEFGFGFRDDWTAHHRRLLRLVPGLLPGSPINQVHQVGYSAGERRPKDVEPGHPFIWVIYGRDQLAEDASTANLGLSTILLRSRQAAGSLPDDEALYHGWVAVRGEPDPIGRFHEWLAAW